MNAGRLFPQVNCTQCGEGFSHVAHAGYDRCSSHGAIPSDDAIDRSMHALKQRDGYQTYSNRRALELQVHYAGFTA